MKKRVIQCSNCGKTFLPNNEGWSVVEKLAARGAQLAMIECTECGHAMRCNPTEILQGPRATQPKKSAPDLRCPVLGCTGRVSEVDDGESTFWGCGACGTIWATRGALSGAITRIVKKFPYRGACYIREGTRWDPAALESEPGDYETRVEAESARSQENAAKGSSNARAGGTGKQDDAKAVKTLEELDADLEFDSRGHVKQVNLADAEIEDADLAALSGLVALRELWLTCTDVTDGGLGHVASHTGLRKLYLEDTRITDAGLVHLEPLTKLRTLDLRSVPISGEGFVHLRGMKDLRTLCLYDTNVTDKALMHLTHLPKLDWLGLDKTQVTDAGLRHLGKIISLGRLDLVDTRVTDAGLKHLKRLKNLRLLTLTLTEVTDAGVEVFRKMLPKCEVSIR